MELSEVEPAIRQLRERLDKVERSGAPKRDFWQLATTLSYYEDLCPDDGDMVEWAGRAIHSQKQEIESAHEAIDESDHHPSTHPYDLCERIQMMRKSWGRTIELQIEEITRLKGELERQTNAARLLSQSLVEIDNILSDMGFPMGTCAERVREIARELEQRRRK